METARNTATTTAHQNNKVPNGSDGAKLLPATTTTAAIDAEAISSFAATVVLGLTARVSLALTSRARQGRSN
jgi:hypothetical protein